MIRMRQAMLAAVACVALASCQTPAVGAEPRTGSGLSPLTVAGEAEHPLIGTVWSPAEQANITWDELVRRAASARFVMLGEKHDNPGHHQLQAMLIRALTVSGRSPAVVWEMIDFSQQRALDGYLSSEDATADGMGPAIGWDRSGWPAWPNYQPIAEAAIEAGLTQYPGNIDRTTVRAVSREGYAALNDPTAEALIGAAGWGDAEEAALNADLVESHCGFMPDAMLGPMARVQRARGMRRWLRRFWKPIRAMAPC
ncbi:MAG: ChaN family lipoprotein [Minwuia sp.]|uniref:ChaN family lipoprotein n=1 Tax=Minwuia sp. TaxID=2493630 RepID=UPI003A884DB1